MHLCSQSRTLGGMAPQTEPRSAVTVRLSLSSATYLREEALRENASQADFVERLLDEYRRRAAHEDELAILQKRKFGGEQDPADDPGQIQLAVLPIMTAEK